MSNFNIKTPLSHILSSKNVECVEATKLLTDWKEPTEDQTKTRDVFLALMGFHESSLFDGFKDHMFWNNWQSKSSHFKHGAIWYACNHAKDPLWVKSLVDHAEHPPSLEELLAVSCGSVKSHVMLSSIMTWAEEDDKREDINRFFSNPQQAISVAKRGSCSALKSIIQKDYLPVRVLEIEQAVCQRGTHKNNYPRKEILLALWGKWGHPTDDQFGELLVATLDKSRKRFNSDFEDFILSFYNPLSPTWNSQHDEILLLTFLPKRLKYIEQCLTKGWVVSDETWERVFAEKKHQRQITPDLEALCLKWQVLGQLSSSVAPSSPRRKL